MVVAREGDEILSMIHLNPYVYNICGDIKNVHYLVAIATKKEHRGKGLMASCMNKAVEYLKSLNCHPRWLQKYVEKVIMYLERDGEE